jgi:hypothetical protein
VLGILTSGSKGPVAQWLEQGTHKYSAASAVRNPYDGELLGLVRTTFRESLALTSVPSEQGSELALLIVFAGFVVVAE